MTAESGSGLPAAPMPRAGAALQVAVIAPTDLDTRRVRRVVEHAGCVVTDTQVEGHAAPDAVVLVVAEGALAEPISSALRSSASVSVVVVSRRDDRVAVEEAVGAGAMGFVSEDQLEARLGATVYAAAAGQLTVPSEYRRLVERPILSRREKQVLSMVVLGFSNVEVANKLHVTEATVKSHLSSAYRKLDVRSRHEATDLILSNPRLGLGILTLSADHTPG
jgi:DNA-binding NarL/FixJ family response regulator